MPADRDYQKQYFSGRGRTRRIDPALTPCVRRHFASTIGPLGLRAGDRVLELGCGVGRFTRLLLAGGFEVTAVDLSADLVERLRAELGAPERLRVLACAAEDLGDRLSGPFDAAVGFFFLHHLDGFDAVFRGLRGLLAERGKLAFCEPNAFNPLVYLQVTFTPGMSWRGEPGVPRMRRGAVFPALRRHGFVDLRSELYGALPPVMANTRLGAAVERGIERLRPLRPLLAHRTFTARLADRRPEGARTGSV